MISLSIHGVRVRTLPDVGRKLRCAVPWNVLGWQRSATGETPDRRFQDALLQVSLVPQRQRSEDDRIATCRWIWMDIDTMFGPQSTVSRA